LLFSKEEGLIRPLIIWSVAIYSTICANQTSWQKFQHGNTTALIYIYLFFYSWPFS